MNLVRRAMLALGCAMACGGVGAKAPTPPAGVTPRMLLETVDISGVTLSPDRRHVAFRLESSSAERDAHDSAWYVLDVQAAAAPLRIADAGAPLRSAAGFALAEAPQWSGDGRWLYYRALLDGAVQVWRAARDGSGAEPVTRDPANVEQFALEGDGSRLLYRVGAARDAIAQAEQDEYDQGIRFDDTVLGQQQLFRGAPIEGRRSSHRSPQGLGLLSDQPKRFHVVDLATLQVGPASAPEAARLQADGAAPQANPDARAHAVSPDGRWMAVVSGRYPDSDLRLHGLQGQPDMPCSACAGMTIEGVAWRNEQELVFTARDLEQDYANALYAWRPQRDRLRQIAVSQGLLGADRFGQGTTCATGDRYAFCVAAAADIAPRLERVDLDTGTRKVVLDPNAPLTARGRATARLEFLRWSSAAGKAFTGYLLVPAGEPSVQRRPLFITYFRCPGYLRGGYGDEWPLLSLVDSGIAVLCMSRPTRPSMWDQVALDDYADALEGIRAAVDLLDAQGRIDRRKVGMGGMSYGGEVVAWVARNASLLAAASVANNQVSPTWYWFSALARGRAEAIMRRWQLGYPDETPELWERLSPTSGVGRVDAPFLMQLPESEFRANLEFHVRMVRSGRPSELWVYPEETHAKQRPRVKLAVYERNLDWFRFWLQGQEDPAPRKAAQYARWRNWRQQQCVRLAGAQAPWYCAEPR